MPARPSARSIRPPVLDPVQARVQFGQRLWASGLGREADRLVATGLDGVRVVGAATARGSGVACRSWIGGEPELPESAEWPSFRGVPQSFLAQIDLAEVHAALPGSPLPPAGALAFFHAHDAPWDASCGPGGAARVVTIAAGTPVWRRRIPSAVPPGARFRPVPVAFVHEVSFPLWIPEAVEDAADEVERFDTVDNGELDELLRFADDMANPPGEEPMHRLLGHPTPIQHAVTGDRSSLLLQLDSDASAGMMWGDAGMLYWTIGDDDLAAHRWDRCSVTLQCC